MEDIGFLNFFFFPLISKFLLTLIKRKNHPCAPYVPTAPTAASIQRQEVERCLMSWLRGSSKSNPPGHVLGGFGVPGATLEMWERAVQNLVMCSYQEHWKSTRPSTSKCSSEGHGPAPRCTRHLQGLQLELGFLPSSVTGT